MLLPKSQWSWFLDQPDNVLSSAGFHYDMLGRDYAFTEKMILREPYHEHVIHKYLPRRLPSMIPSLQDEVAVGFAESWGNDTHEWKEVRLYDSVMFMVSHAVNRMIVGLPLCRNEDFLRNARSFATSMIPSSMFITFTPNWLKPVVGRLVTLPNLLYYRRMAKYLKPLIEERKANYAKMKSDPSFDFEMPNDFISWTILLADAENRPDEGAVDRISRRVLPIEFASIHTSAISVTQCLFDLISSDPSLKYLSSIRQEAEDALNKTNGEWTKAGLAECYRADSALRESMRISNFMPINATKKVISKNGITHPSEGWHAPKGTNIGFDMHNPQHDPENYPNADVYEAFRFAPTREDKSQPSKGLDSKEDGTAIKGAMTGNTNLATTSETWFPFSRGAHTCPGRFLIAAEIKILLAYMTMNYDIQPLITRPPNMVVGTNILPPPDATIKIRRKSKNPRT